MSDLPAKPPPVIDPLAQVVTWIIAGNSEAHIRESIEATWPEQKPQPLMIAAVKELAKNGRPDLELVFGFAIEGTRTIYQRALELGDLQTALRAIKQLTELAHNSAYVLPEDQAHPKKAKRKQRRRARAVASRADGAALP